MAQQNHKVKVPCNHTLEYLELLFGVDPGNTDQRTPWIDCSGCGSDDGYGYYCDSCSFGGHAQCIDYPDIINLPCHSRHPLKKVSLDTVDYTDGCCHFCRGELHDPVYHCFTCNFSICLNCARNPPPLTIYQPKSHNHTFTLMARKVSFICNTCGLDGDRDPYVCVECAFMLHQDCINLPRVININRHQHRVHRTDHLARGEWECGVCRTMIDWTFGAFSCKRCPNYAVHSKCAVRRDVWDGKELEDEPEEEEEEDPYKVINDREILHYIHKHNLRLGDDNGANYEKMRCDACIRPISSDPFFKCVQCEFFLHKVCASLPRKKQNILHKHKLIVEYSEGRKEFKCEYCLQYSDGFKFYCEVSKESVPCTYFVLDTGCASIYEPFYHELHPHPLYRTSAAPNTCGACGQHSEYVLSCIVCKFYLGMECATLPRKVNHRCDDHVLLLHHGAGNSKGPLWCFICEGKTDPSVWYYGCDDCGATLHIKCVLGDMSKLKPGKHANNRELVLNNGMSRPFCCDCGNRCIFPSFLKATATPSSTAIYACSINCAIQYRWRPGDRGPRADFT